MGQVDAQAKFYRRLFGKRPTPTLEGVPAHAVPTLAAAFAYLATKDGWRLGPIPMWVWATVALAMFFGIHVIMDELVAATIPDEARGIARSLSEDSEERSGCWGVAVLTWFGRR